MSSVNYNIGRNSNYFLGKIDSSSGNIQKNKVVQHALKYENWLGEGSEKGNGAKDGVLDENELYDLFFNHIGDGEHDYIADEQIEAWIQSNIDNNNIKDGDITKQDVLELLEFIKAPDGTINTSQQGQTGDCYLLTTLNSLTYSDAGKQAINDVIDFDEETGVTTITFKGIEKKYTVTKDELQEEKIAGGDNDVRAIEIAYRKFREELEKGDFDSSLSKDMLKFLKAGGFGNEEDALNGGWMAQIVYLMTGQKGEMLMRTEGGIRDIGNNTIIDKEGIEERLADFGKNPSSYSFTISFNEDALKDVAPSIDSGKETDETAGIVSGHAYAIKRIEGDNVVLINPWNSGVEITMPKNIFVEIIDSMTLIKLVNDSADTPNRNPFA